MEQGRLTRVLYILGTIAVFILAILFIIWIIGRISSRTSKKANTTTSQISDFADSDNSVSYKADGVINGNENHRAIKITVTNKSRMLEIISGYQGQVIYSQSYTNNVEAYKEFLSALQKSGYLIQRKNIANTTLEGACPLGNRYIFETIGIDISSEMLWTTSCASTQGTFGGKINVVQTLFQKQIPNYSKQVSTTSLH